MKIDLYTMSWNEEQMLGFFFRHYDPIVARYVVYDDGSTDGTLHLLHSRPNVEVRRFKRVVEGSYVLSAQQLHNEVWKESRNRADWVIITAIDEHLHHAHVIDYLTACKRGGVTAVPSLGFQMVAAAFPQPHVHLASSVTRGAPFAKMSKLSILDPSAIEETRFGAGRHIASPIGRVRYPDKDEVLNLHYKYLGIDYVRRRHAMLRSGLGEVDRQSGFGHRYLYTDRETLADIAYFEARSFELMSPDIDLSDLHAEPRWWRARPSIPKDGSGVAA